MLLLGAIPQVLNRKRALIFVCLLLSIGCEIVPSPVTEEPKIYRTLLIHLGADKMESLVIRAESISDGHVIGGFDRLKLVDTEGMKQSFIHVNSAPSRLPLDHGTFKHIVVISSRTIDDIFRLNSLEQNWKNFYRKYPKAGGIVGFSRVGFNADTTKAAVYFQNVCGPLCGNGYIVYLEKRWTGWKVERITHLWVS